MSAETKIEKIEDFIRALKPKTNFSEPTYRIGLEVFFSPEQDELELETWEAIPKNCRSLIFSRLGELNQDKADRPGYIEDVEVSVRGAVALGVTNSSHEDGRIGNPMVAWALAVSARIKYQRGQEDTGDYLMSLAKEVVDLTQRKPRGRIRVASQVQNILREGQFI